MKSHIFKLTVKTHGTRQKAEYAILVALAKRYPDGCEMHLRKTQQKKEKS